MQFTEALLVAILALPAIAAPLSTTCEDAHTACLASGRSVFDCDDAKAQCITICQAGITQCNGAPGANHATCAAQLCICTGLDYDESLKPQHSGENSCAVKTDQCRNAPGANQASCSAQDAACKANCQTLVDACRVAPGANQAVCSSMYAECLGTNPYGN